MAYISSESVKDKRNRIKKALPEFKFSVTIDNYSSIIIRIVEGPLPMPVYESQERERIHGGLYSDDFRKDNQQVNHYWYKDHYKDFPEWIKVFNQIIEIANEGNYDESDIQSDYHHVGFYLNLEIGRWDKPYINNKQAA